MNGFGLLLNALAAVRQFLPSMLERNSGHIVTIELSTGFFGKSKLVHHCTSKFGAAGFTELIRQEMRDQRKNIKTTCVCPYYNMYDQSTAHTKYKRSFFLPDIDDENIAQRIIHAIHQNEK